MSVKMPDPKEVVDSVADGAMEIAQGPARIASNVAGAAETYASEMEANMEDFKKRMPDDPGAILDCGVKAVGQAARVGLGIVEGVGNGFMDTFAGVKKQIQRVTG